MSKLFDEVKKTIEAGQKLCRQIDELTKITENSISPDSLTALENTIQDLRQKLNEEHKLRLSQSSTFREKFSSLQNDILYWKKSFHDLNIKYLDIKNFISDYVLALASTEDKQHNIYWLAHSVKDNGASFWVKLYINSRNEPKMKNCIEPQQLHKKPITSLPVIYFPLIKKLSHLGNKIFYSTKMSTTK